MLRTKQRLINRLLLDPITAQKKIDKARDAKDSRDQPTAGQETSQGAQADQESDIVSFRDIFQTVPEDERRNFQSQLDINIALGDALGTSGLKIDSDSVNALSLIHI